MRHGWTARRGVLLVAGLSLQSLPCAACVAPIAEILRFAQDDSPKTIELAADTLREFNPDRPDKTEGPFTVPARHLQLEMDFANYTEDRDPAGHVESLALATLTLRLGVARNSDVELILEPWNRERVRGNSSADSSDRSGYSDTLVRLTQNFWGNDGGPTAFGIIPFVKFPTGQNGLGNRQVEGGVILPFAAELPRDWGLGAMIEVDWNRDDGERRYHPLWIESISVSHALGARFDGYVELWSAFPGGGSPDTRWIGTLDLGLIYSLRDNVRFDVGVNLGISGAAPDVSAFTGLAVRF